MGSTAEAPSAAPSLADALFTRTQQRVLALLFGQPERSFYANELIGLAGMGSGAVQRELTALAGSGLVTVRSVGNQKHYQANADAPIFEELRGIVQKTFGWPSRCARRSVRSRRSWSRPSSTARSPRTPPPRRATST